MSRDPLDATPAMGRKWRADRQVSETPDPLTYSGTCARYFGSDGTLCATHNGRFASTSENNCDRSAAARPSPAEPPAGDLRAARMLTRAEKHVAYECAAPTSTRDTFIEDMAALRDPAPIAASSPDAMRALAEAVARADGSAPSAWEYEATAAIANLREAGWAIQRLTASPEPEEFHSMLGHEHCDDECEVRTAGEALDQFRFRIEQLPWLDVVTGDDGSGGRMVALDAVLAAIDGPSSASALQAETPEPPR